jgi:hypothetical protein
LQQLPPIVHRVFHLIQRVGLAAQGKPDVLAGDRLAVHGDFDVLDLREDVAPIVGQSHMQLKADALAALVDIAKALIADHVRSVTEYVAACHFVVS